MGGLREGIHPKDGSLDGGLEWNYSQRHFYLERTQNSSRDTQTRGGGFKQTQRYNGVLIHIQ
jgi:hypothetical protein